MRFSTNLNLINKNQYARIVSVILLIEGLVMIPAFGCAVLYGEQRLSVVFAVLSAALLVLGFLGRKCIKSIPSLMRVRDGFLYVVTSMLLVILISSLPFLFAGEGYSFVNSWFESASGWTTTGAHVLDRVGMPYSLILWKSELNFMGGFVMIFLTVSVFEKLGIGGQKSVAHDIPGANFEKLTVKMGESARILIKVYIILTLIEFVLLMLSGMAPYYALANSMSSMSTSGLVIIENGEPGFIMTPLIKFILTLFTILGSLNFVIYFLIYTGDRKLALKNFEAKLYFLVIGISSIVIMISLIISGKYGIFASFYNAFIQTVSYASTSGFTMSEITAWPSLAKAILVFLPIFGGCGFSTSSGLKIHRAVILYKIAIRGVYKRIHPKSMRPVMLSGKPVAAERAASITVLGLLYFAVLVLSSVVFSLDDLGIETSLSAAVASLTNNGTSFGLLTNGDFSIFSDPIKFFSTVVMISGRLELYAIFVFFSRSFWDTNRATG